MQTQQQFPICVVRSFFRFTSFATYFVRISLRNYNTTKTVDSFPFRKGRERERRSGFWSGIIITKRIVCTKWSVTVNTMKALANN